MFREVPRAHFFCALRGYVSIYGDYCCCTAVTKQKREQNSRFFFFTVSCMIFQSCSRRILLLKSSGTEVWGLGGGKECDTPPLSRTSISFHIHARPPRRGSQSFHIHASGRFDMGVKTPLGITLKS